MPVRQVSKICCYHCCFHIETDTMTEKTLSSGLLRQIVIIIIIPLFTIIHDIDQTTITDSLAETTTTVS